MILKQEWLNKQDIIVYKLYITNKYDEVQYINYCDQEGIE